jgi:hypothetical protein
MFFVLESQVYICVVGTYIVISLHVFQASKRVKKGVFPFVLIIQDNT